MLSAFADGARDIAAKPSMLAIPLIGAAIGAAVFLLALESYENILFSTLIFGEVPDVSAMQMPFFFFASYPEDTIIVLASAFVAVLVWTLSIFAFARMVSERKAGLLGALGFAASKLSQAFGLALGAFAGGAVYFAVAYYLFAASISFEAAGLMGPLALALWLAFGAYSYVKFAFSPLFIAVQGMPLKKALAASWKWAAGKFIPLAAFLALLYVASGAVSAVGFAVSDAVQQEEVSFLVALLGFCAANAYSNAVFVRFFLASRR